MPYFVKFLPIYLVKKRNIKKYLAKKLFRIIKLRKILTHFLYTKNGILYKKNK